MGKSKNRDADERQPLPTDPSGDAQLYRDPEILRECYWVAGKTLAEIGDRLGCSDETVAYWMRKHEIARRDSAEYRRRVPVHFRTHQGYERWYTTIDGSTKSVLVHRLLAIAEYGFDRVCGNHVHHRNGISWDNRPSNIDVLSPEEHLRHEAQSRMRESGRFVAERSVHQAGKNRCQSVVESSQTKSVSRRTWDDERYANPWRDPAFIQYLYVECELSTLSIGDRLGCCNTTVRYWLKAHDIPRRTLSDAQLARVRRDPVPFGTRPPHARDAGYEFWHHTYRTNHSDGEQSWVPVHRLLAVACYGFEAVCDRDVHHINGICWDNRPDNITILSRERHARITRLNQG